MPASGPSLNGITAIKAIASSLLANRTAVWDSSAHNAAKLYVYNSASTATADDDLILRPNDVLAASPGRWEKNVGAGGGVTVDSAIVTTLPSAFPGVPNYPSLKPTSTPTSIGETKLVYRKYSGTMVTAFFSTYTLAITRVATWTAIGLTANDWITDASASVDLEYFTEDNNPISSNPGFSLTGDLRIQADYPGQICTVRFCTSAGWGHQQKCARQVNYDTGLPVLGSTTKWWEWQAF